jgi:hypothetical protein
MEMNLEKPKSRSPAKSSTAVHKAPLWEMNETLPALGMRAEKLALRRTSDSGLITPRQLGPTRRTPLSRQIAMIFFSISRPSPPTSLNPAETMTTPLTPFSMASCTDWMAILGGTMIMARSRA